MPSPLAAAGRNLLALAGLMLSALALCAPPAGHAQTAATDAADPYIWLETNSPRTMDWVEDHNAKATAVLEANPRYPALYQEALTLAEAKDRIPSGEFLHGAIYNFWQDGDHLRGIWRKTTLASYQTETPDWTTVLDVTALGKAEGKSWVFKGVDCVRPSKRRCLVNLSEGGEDAATIREFDLDTGKFVEDGFVIPKSKARVAWEDENTLLISNAWAPGELTASGYPYIVKRLKRGQRLDQAVEVYRGAKADGGYGVSPDVLHDSAGHRLAVIVRPLDTFRAETYVVTPKGAERLNIPSKASVDGLLDGRVIIKTEEDWTAGGKTFPAGALVWTSLDALKADPAHLKPTLLFAAGPKEALEDTSSTRDKLLLTVLDNVKGRVYVYTPTPAGFSRTRLDLPDNATVRVTDADDDSDRAFIGVSSFLTPSSLWLADTASGALKQVKSLPAKFDASADVVEQFEATSKDGTKVPYFVVHRRDLKYDGSNPTLMTAYGGFQVSSTPNYSATTGKLWLEKGGVYVLANIRGGGEFGPRWHEAGLVEKRQVIYDDFAGVAQDLIRRKITSPRRLGIEGGSNGGLLMGVEFTQHPDLWNAVVIDVPLLDMIRISKIAAGASWQGEYGDVNANPKAMAFWLKTSPYQNLKTGVKYPEPFIFTTTKDDRVGPQHARKFAARMEEMRLPFLFYENTEGGHGAGADLKQQAHTTALTMTYLQMKLMN
ncbi:MAG TPA: prolyl oligopeptidase family serine peptidase [Phenylobacterium sp.]|uniref:prolyl oligopeptidase family serine peptidase n=1 Tax=Phenylobacterium sp. TaxID=1871053 RepID=UPI002D40EA3E|nr:prolyl oligopeptidase family serine peptidase [Phenylobacterium sp.]HZZ67084.1 prolyl oligopeptidase family serine peptidase [Phenylobacterium sp.]